MARRSKSAIYFNIHSTLQRIEDLALEIQSCGDRNMAYNRIPIMMSFSPKYMGKMFYTALFNRSWNPGILSYNFGFPTPSLLFFVK